MIDTLDLAERLRAGGFTEQQARTAAGAFGHAPGQQFASKADIDALRLSTRADLDRFGVDLRAELQKGTGALRVELHKEMRDLAWKMAGLLLAQGGAIVALIKLIP
jgi:protein involved in temperature-dependent protein secretion